MMARDVRRHDSGRDHAGGKQRSDLDGDTPARRCTRRYRGLLNAVSRHRRPSRPKPPGERVRGDCGDRRRK